MRLLKNTMIEMLNPTEDFGSSIDRLLYELSQKTSADAISDASSIVPQDYMFSNILTDSGSGRISSGLQSLELLSILCTGVDQSQLFLFDSVIYTGTASQIKRANDDQLTRIVLDNLGMSSIVDNISSTLTVDYLTLCLKIGKLVRSGNFKASAHRKNMIKQSKIMINYYIKEQNA